MSDDRVENPKLDRSIGLLRLISQSVATMAPGASIVFSLGLVISYAGGATPLSMLIAAGVALLIALSIGQLVRHIPSAGGFYAYATAAFGDSVGFLVGWIYSALYILLICVTAISFSIVGSDFLTFYAGVSVPQEILSVALVLSITGMTYLGIRPSTTLTLVLAAVEVALLFLVAVLLIVRSAGETGVSVLVDPAMPSQRGVGLSVLLGVMFALASMSGFESSAPLAEEARTPRKILPRAVLMATGAIGLFYVIASYAAVVGWGPSRLASFNEAANPWREMAGEIGGFFALLVVFAILNSQIASVQGSFNASSRLLFAMSRNRMLPQAISRLHSSRRTPYVAAFVAAVIALGAVFLARARFGGGYPALVFFLTIATIIFVFLYSVVSVASTAFYLRSRRSEFRFHLHVAAPALALIVLVPTLFVSVRGLEYPANLAIRAVLIWAALGAAVLLVLRSRGVDISKEGQRWLQRDLSVTASPPGLEQGR